MKYLFIPIIILTSLSCTETQVEEVTKIYSMDDVGVTGIKMKGDFKTDFPERGHAGKLKAGLFDFALGASILEIFFNCFSLLFA